jgi:hypothetical protein
MQFERMQLVSLTRRTYEVRLLDASGSRNTKFRYSSDIKIIISNILYCKKVGIYEISHFDVVVWHSKVTFYGYRFRHSSHIKIITYVFQRLWCLC